MTTFETAILFLLAGLFLAVLVAGLAIVIFAALRVKTAAETLAIQLRGFQTENEKITESAKSNFSSIRKEMREALESYSKETKETLASHQKQMGGMIESINGAGLGVAAKSITDATRKLTQIAEVLRDLLVAREEVEETGTGAEEYAPTGASIYQQGTTAMLDAEAQAGEQA